MKHTAKIALYHNPRCSKSREALNLLRERGVEPEVILYLETPPDAASLKQLLHKLGISARALLRKGEEAYKELGLGYEHLSEETLIEAMVKNPKLIERPIAIKDQFALIGRPPENVLQLLNR